MDIKEVENLAELARIELTNTEKQALLEDVEGILDYVKQIGEVEVSEMDVEHSVRNVWREDEPRESVFSRDLIIEQFPDSKDGFLKVKKIL